MISDKVRSGGTSKEWYLRSLADQDTHRGELQPDGTVSAACGAAFRPRALGMLGSLALAGGPADLDQICPALPRTDPERDLTAASEEPWFVVRPVPSAGAIVPVVTEVG